ncbi:MAG: helix-turn-helix domain-containing protein [Cyanobacteria bacterium J06607_6]
MTALLSKGQLGARQFKRATGLLELDRGKTIQAVCDTLGVNRVTVRKWRDPSWPLLKRAVNSPRSVVDNSR